MILLIYFSFFLTPCSAWLVQVDSFGDECFYELAEEGSKIGFEFQVVDGGFLDIDLTINGPDGHEIYVGSRKSSDKYIFSSYQNGKYRFCFSNKMSTVTTKTVMFDVYVGQKATELHTDESTPAFNQSARFHTMVTELGQALSSVRHDQEYILVRNSLHHQTIEHTNTVVGRWELLEAVFTFGGVSFQVWYIRRFFEIRRIV